MKLIIKLILVIAGVLQAGCAIMHHTQIGEVDSRIVLKGRRFEIKVSEVGFNIQEAGKIGKAMTRHKGTQKQIGQVQAIIEMFQMGPKTGNPVFTDEYSDRVFSLVRKECPSLKFSGLTSVRETAKYPVVSGEIVKIVGFCLGERGKNDDDEDDKEQG